MTQYSQNSRQSSAIPDPEHHEKVTKLQEDTTHKRAKRSAISFLDQDQDFHCLLS